MQAQIIIIIFKSLFVQSSDMHTFTVITSATTYDAKTFGMDKYVMDRTHMHYDISKTYSSFNIPNLNHSILAATHQSAIRKLTKRSHGTSMSLENLVTFKR